MSICKRNGTKADCTVDLNLVIVILLVVMVNSLLITNGNAYSKLNAFALSDARSVDKVHVPSNRRTNTNVDIVKSNKKEKIILLPLPTKASKGGYIDFDAKTYDKYRHHHNTTASKYEAIPMLKNMNLTQVYHYHDHVPELRFGKNAPLWIRFPSSPSDTRSSSSNDVNVSDTEVHSQLKSTNVSGRKANAKYQSENAPRGMMMSIASFVFFTGTLVSFFAHRLKKKRRNAQTLEDVVEGDFYYFYGAEGLEVPSEADYGSFASPWISDLHKFDV